LSATVIGLRRSTGDNRQNKKLQVVTLYTNFACSSRLFLVFLLILFCRFLSAVNSACLCVVCDNYTKFFYHICVLLEKRVGFRGPTGHSLGHWHHFSKTMRPVYPTGDRCCPPWNHPPPAPDTGTELSAVDSI